MQEVEARYDTIRKKVMNMKEFFKKYLCLSWSVRPWEKRLYDQIYNKKSPLIIEDHDTGKITCKGYLVNAKNHGFFQYFDGRTGALECEGNYFQGSPEGEWIHYKSDGSIKKKEVYKNGKLMTLDSSSGLK